MKNLKKIMLFGLTMLLVVPVWAKEIKVPVKGMVCAFCAQGIKKKFKAMPEIQDVKVKLESGEVTLITKDGRDIDDAVIAKTLDDAGYATGSIKRGTASE
jgi:copper chaperone CopZ